VLPYLEDVFIESEDAQSRQRLRKNHINDPLDIAVIGLKRVSNNTDVEQFQYEEDVSVRIVSNAREFGSPHAVIIPGTKSTLDDMEELSKNGLDRAICEYAKCGGTVFGICGGYQMLGERICDEICVDRALAGDRAGLGLLPLETSFVSQKRVLRVSGRIICKGFLGIPVEGYEIHLGRTQRTGPVEDFADLGGRLDGRQCKRWTDNGLLPA
jgi:adenosylcobyric acid synthase